MLPFTHPRCRRIFYSEIKISLSYLVFAQVRVSNNNVKFVLLTLNSVKNKQTLGLETLTNVFHNEL